MYNIVISNPHVSLTTSIKKYIEVEVKKHAEKFSGFIHGNIKVTLKVEKHLHIVECQLHSKKQQFFATSNSEDMYGSIDKTFKDVFGQVKKQKDIANRSKNENKRQTIKTEAA
jgi:ribosomal subunit interface protein